LAALFLPAWTEWERGGGADSCWGGMGAEFSLDQCCVQDERRSMVLVRSSSDGYERRAAPAPRPLGGRRALTEHMRDVNFEERGMMDLNARRQAEARRGIYPVGGVRRNIDFSDNATIENRLQSLNDLDVNRPNQSPSSYYSFGERTEGEPASQSGTRYVEFRPSHTAPPPNPRSPLPGLAPKALPVPTPEDFISSSPTPAKVLSPPRSSQRDSLLLEKVAGEVDDLTQSLQSIVRAESLPGTPQKVSSVPRGAASSPREQEF